MPNIVKLRSLPPAKPKPLDQVRNEIRTRHYSDRTEEAYIAWIKRFVRFHGIRHPAEMGKHEIEAFLSDLAIRHKVASSTQNQALSSLLFLYKEVLRIDLDWLDAVVYAKRPSRLPVVVTREEVRAVLAHLDGPQWIASMLMYGSGLRLMECLRLRIKDIDFGYRQITVWEGKGKKDRGTMMPYAVETRLRFHLDEVKKLHEPDTRTGGGYVMLPGALAKKYPNANREWGWQWVFPATRRFKHPLTA